MIKSFAHNGLEDFFMKEINEESGPLMRKNVRYLDRPDAVVMSRDMNCP